MNISNEQEPFNNETIDLMQYWRTVRRSKWLITLTTLLFVAAGYFVATSMTPIYQASSKILADPTPPNTSREEQYIASAMIFLFYETQYEIIQSRAIAETVVDKLGLVERYKKDQQKAENEPKSFIENAKIEIKALLGSDLVEEERTEISDADLRVMLAAMIQGSVSVSGGKQSQIINISYQDKNPELATEIINAIAQAYIQFGLESRLGEVKNTEAWLSEQSMDLKAQLEESENRLKEFRLQQGVMDSNLQDRDSNQRIQNLNTQLLSAQTKLSEQEEIFAKVNELAPDSRAFYSLAPVLANRVAGELVRDEARLQSRVNEFFQRYKEKHPKMIAARSELASVQASLSQEIAKIVEGIESEYRVSKQQVANIEKLLSEERARIQEMQGASFSLTSLEREVENNRRVYESFLNQLMETNIKSDFNASNVQIIDSATVPKFPIKPNLMLILALSLFLGFTIGITITFLREAIHDTFRTPEMLEDKLKLPSLGMTIKLTKKELKTIPEMQYSQDPRSIFVENINTIRTSLMFSNIDNPPKCILVTSSTGSEGKSTLAMNLASSYSQLGKTLLLEVDLRKPSVGRNLNIPPRTGLADILAGTIELNDALVKPVEGTDFSVLTCGTIPHNPIELLTSKKFSELLDIFKEQFDYIVLDGAPTLPVSDATVLGSKVDGVIVAVKAEQTKIKATKETIKRLVTHNANVIGVVLTVAEPHKMTYYGDHYYGSEYYGVDSKSSK